MAGIYYPQLLDVLRAAGVTCSESNTTKGWQTRARSSGGFPSTPLGVIWHHTASSTSPANDLSFMINGSSDAPVGNMLLDRSGVVWPIAAGAANTAGKGGPFTFSRGTVPQDQANTRTWNIEAANNGVGEPWPTVQIDAYFKASNALQALCGNRPDDICGHAHWTPGRKIDPATAGAVQGSWRPRSINSSQTWNLDDMRNEAARRASSAPTPTPPDPGPTPPGGTVAQYVFESQTNPREYNAMFFGTGDTDARTIELQWSGNGDDPAVQERVATMLANFGPARPLLLAGIRNNRLHPKHRPSDIVDSLHQWVDADFAPQPVDAGTWSAAGLAGAEAVTIGVLLVRRRKHERRRRLVIFYDDANRDDETTERRHAPDPVTPSEQRPGSVAPQLQQVTSR